MSIYDFSIKNRQNEDVSLADYKGKVLARYESTVEPETIENDIKKII